MPRLTRRSAASQEEAAPETEESPKTSSRGRRGGKKEEPKPEEAAIGEPAEGPSKRGGRQSAKGKQAESKEATPKKGKSPASGRATSRSKRGNKQEESDEEPEQEQEEEEEVEEEQLKGGARSRGKGAKGPAKGGRGSKKAEEETKEPEEEKTEAEQEDVGDTSGTTSSGAKGKNKTPAATPSPRGGRKGRGKAAAEPAEEEQEDSKNGKEDEPTDVTENEVNVEPKGRQKRTPNQTSQTTPPSGGRRSRGQKPAESITKTPPARSSRRGGSAPAEVENSEKEEPMEEEVKSDEEPKAQDETPAAKGQDSPSKKRKLEEEAEDKDLKRQRVDKAKSAEESKEEAKEDELVDFVVVSKDDVPAPDSKEVVESLPPLIPPESDSEHATESKPFTQVEMAEATFVVPLTEAELAKQYAPQPKQDVDETSSTLVEVGSEAASDITGLSRGLDFSDAVSLDSSISADQPMEARSDNPLGTPDKDQAPEFAEVTMEKEASAEDDDPIPAVDQVAEDELTTERKINMNHSATDCNNSALPNQSLNILNRNFLLNPLVPAELMDPAYCFSVVSYNILADCHLKRGDYSYRETRFLDKDYRHFILMKELDYLNGDIVCLQEVNPAYYKEALLPAMASRGYEGSFFKRTKVYWDEGAATFVKKNKFSVISSDGISLRDLAYKGVDSFNLSPEISEAAKQYLDRADVVLLTQVKLLKTSQVITICNIHVVYDIEALDVQCIQVACAVKELVSKAGSDLNPHIICGDFNSVLNSPAYQLARDGYLTDSNIKKLQAIQALKVSTDASKSLVNQMWGAFQHTSSNLQSAYNVVMKREPLCTTYTKSSYGTLDYIFYSSLSLDVVGVLETIDDKAVRGMGGLPTSSIPSDHLSLKAVFRPRDEKE